MTIFYIRDASCYRPLESALRTVKESSAWIFLKEGTLEMELKTRKRALLGVVAALVALAAFVVGLVPSNARAASADAEDVYRIYIQTGDPYGGLSDTWVTSDNIFSQSVFETMAENGYGFKAGDEEMLGDGNTYTFDRWIVEYYLLDVDEVPTPEDFSFTGYSDDYAYCFYDLAVEAQWIPDPETGVWEPWAPGTSELRPYTIENGALTFDGLEEELGTWYQVDLDLEEGVECLGVVSGGVQNTVTLDASMLEKDDPLYDSNGWLNGPFWIRADLPDDYSSLSFEFPSDKALTYELVGDGMVSRSVGSAVLLLKPSSPATLKVGLSDETVINNEAGASLSHAASALEDEYGTVVSDDLRWSALSLSTEQLSGDALDAAVAADGNVVAGYDVTLIEPAGSEFEFPEGELVTLTLPIPEGVDASRAYLLRVGDDGVAERLDASFDAESGTVSVSTTALGTFAFAQAGTVELTEFSFVDDEVTADGAPVGGGRVLAVDLDYAVNEGAMTTVTMEIVSSDPEDIVSLRKVDTTDYYTSWVAVPNGPRGGTAVVKATCTDVNTGRQLTDTIVVNVRQDPSWIPVEQATVSDPAEVTLDLATDKGYELSYPDDFFNCWYLSTVSVDRGNVVGLEVNERGDASVVVPIGVGVCNVTVELEDMIFGGTRSFDVRFVVNDSSTGQSGEDASVTGLPISNESGASVTPWFKNPEEYDPVVWKSLTLVTEWLGGEDNPVSDVVVAAVNDAVKDLQSYVVFDIHLTDAQGNVFEVPDGVLMTVALPIPESMGTTGIQVLHVADDGTVTVMPDVIVDEQNRVVYFTTDHFSTFVVAQSGSGQASDDPQAGEDVVTPETPAGEKDEQTVPETGDFSFVAPLLAAVSGTGALLGARALRRRR